RRGDGGRPRAAADVPLSAARRARLRAPDRRAGARRRPHRHPAGRRVIPRGGRGPSPLLPLSYLTPAAAAFVLAALGVPWLSADLAGHWYHPRLLALTHTVTLGWIS